MRSGDNGQSIYREMHHGDATGSIVWYVARKRNRHGHRDWLIGLIIYRHGLRVSEACDLRWDATC
jgi:hypothetical protein